MKIFFLILCIYSLFSPIFAGSFYVSVNGNDGNTGSLNSPWRTIQYGVTQIHSGDTLNIMPGNYTGFYILENGTQDKPILIRGNGNVVINDPVVFQSRLAGIHIVSNYIQVESIEIMGTNSNDRGIRISSGISEVYLRGVVIQNCKIGNTYLVGISASYVYDLKLLNNEVYNSAVTHGIYVANSSDTVLIEGNYVHDNAKAGIQINADMELPGDHISSQITIVRNLFERNNRVGSGGALNLASVRNSLFAYNVFINNNHSGIALWDDGFGTQWGCKNDTIMNNTIMVPSSSSGHGISIRNGSISLVVFNNVIFHLGGRDAFSIDQSSRTGFESDYNILDFVEDENGNFLSLAEWKNRSGLDQNSFSAQADQIFTDPNNILNGVRPDSPTIDAGYAFYSILDYFGNAPFDVASVQNKGGGIFNYSDIGAIEFILFNQIEKIKLKKLDK